jgi:hypothetical protein
VFRRIALEPTECWFGYIYTKNLGDSEHREELTPKLTGVEVFGRNSSNGAQINIKLCPNGGDDIVILRRFEGNCNFGMSSKILN